jgi:tetratricopeptide (TPR) repeat protein
MPMAVGIAIAGFILLASAGGTFFYLTRPPENQRLYQEGQKQLALGQYAFALKTLGEAVRVKPDDPKALLALARAYVGVDQIDKAWDCIVQAQQLGAGVAAEPQLASDLANYYRQHQQYQRAVELLRQLVSANVGNKRGELADLDAAWGDKCFEDGDYRQSLRCWEEVRDMHEGSRFAEADSRLATIYQKIAEEAMRKGDDEDALKYYAKLNAMAPSATAFDRTAELYQKTGNLELAIDQMRHAVKLAGTNQTYNRKLASLMAARGKELLDSGDVDAGYGYLQQAQTLDPKMKAPTSTIRDVHLQVEAGGYVHLTGAVWNPGPDVLSAITVRGELFDNKAGRTVWSRDLRVIDEFVPPLPAHDSRPFELSATVPADPATSEFRVYLNGGLYRSYALSKYISGDSATVRGGTADENASADKPQLRPRIPPGPSPSPIPDGMPQTAPERVIEKDINPPVAPPSGTSPGNSPEEKTLKDLD